MRAAVLLLWLLCAALVAACRSESEAPSDRAVPQVTSTPPSGARPPAGQASPSPSGGGPVPSPTRPAGSPTVSAPIGPNAGPFSLNDVQQAWAARGLTVSTDASVSVTGFSVTPSSLKVARGAATSTLLVFAYASQAALEQDWSAGAGAPAPKAGKNPGTYVSAWWNQNVVVLLRARGAASDDARDAFLALGPGIAAVASVTPTAARASPGPAPVTPSATVAPATPTSTPAPTQPAAMPPPR